MKRLLIFGGLVLFAALFITACGAASASSLATPTAVSPTSATLPATPTQTVSPSPTITISPAARLLLGVYENSSTPHGSETLTLLDGGRYTQQVPSYRVNVRGTWAIAAGQIVFTETMGGDCPGYPGTYKFVMDGKAVTLSRIQDDHCSPRTVDFASGAWIKKP